MEEYNDNTDNQELEINLEEQEEAEEDTVSISKKELSKLKRKAIAYDSTEKKPKNINNNESKPYNILEDEVADLILDGYSKDETKFILANGGREALNNTDSYVAVAINAKREQRRVENAVNETVSSGYATPGGKTFTEEQLRNMTAEEMEQVLPRA